MVSNISIKKLTLNNFRNHKYLKLDISKNMILIYGQNGSGKTSVLESISLFDSSNGFRASTLSEIINNDFAIIKLNMRKGSLSHDLSLQITLWNFLLPSTF